MLLPRFLLITDSARMRPTFTAALAAALRGGARLIQLREKNRAAHEILALAGDAQRLCASFGAQLVINSHADVARTVGAAGVHWPEHELSQAARPALDGLNLQGFSIHSIPAAQRAVVAGATYLTFGPVFPTVTHPHTPPAGLDSLRRIVEAVEVPVFAIGGIDAVTTRQCRVVGAHGSAVISAVWQAPDVEAATRQLVAASEPGK